MSSKSSHCNESSKKSSIFGQRVEALSDLISGASSKAQEKEGNPMTMVAISGVIIPIVVFIILWFSQPAFVTKTDVTPPEKDYKKITSWTILFTVVIWIMMYLCVNYYGGSQVSS
jgi:heme/copper-type cytochrome/quinol oxidase subunit 2